MTIEYVSNTESNKMRFQIFMTFRLSGLLFMALNIFFLLLKHKKITPLNYIIEYQLVGVLCYFNVEFGSGLNIFF